MFGKRLSQYLDFQKVVLGLLAAVGLARLGLSLAGVPDTTVAWLSMNVVAWAGALLLLWGVASLVLLVRKRVARRSAVA